MSTEKFFENGGRPVEMVEQAQFLNAKPEQEGAESDVVGPLPSPASACSSKPKPKLSAAMIIPIWIVLSSGVIIYNNYLYNTLNFKYPVFLVTFHLGFAVRAPRPTPMFFAYDLTISFLRQPARAYWNGRRASSMAQRTCTYRRICLCDLFFP